MANLDLDGIRHIATLAALSLSEEEEQRLTGEIGRIVAYVAELDAVDTTGVPPTLEAGAAGRVAGADASRRSGDGWREDVVEPCLSHEDALAAAPQAERGGFAVPGFVE